MRNLPPGTTRKNNSKKSGNNSKRINKIFGNNDAESKCFIASTRRCKKKKTGHRPIENCNGALVISVGGHSTMKILHRNCPTGGLPFSGTT